MEPKPAARNVKLLAGVVAAIVLIASVTLLARQEVLDLFAEQARTHKEITDRLSRQISGLESQVKALAAVPPPDMTLLDSTRTSLETAQTNLSQLTERVTILENKPAPITASPPPAAALPALKPVSLALLTAAVRAGTLFPAELDAWQQDHPTAIDKTPLLRQAAATGVLTEAQLRHQLSALLNQPATATAPETSLMRRINTHLTGLVSIKKQQVVPPELAALQQQSATAPIETLAAQVAALPPALKRPFASWLETVRQREQVLNELNSLTAYEATL